jgi:hypothetical protein
MKLATFTVVTTLVAFQNLVSCSKILEYNKHIRPFLLNQHPVFIAHGKVNLPDKNFQTFHAEEISSVLVYDFQKFQMLPIRKAVLSRRREGLNITGKRYSLFVLTRFPSFVHIFPNDTNEEVYNFQYQFLVRSGLGFTTRPKITSVTITHEHSIVHRRDLSWRLSNKQYVDKLVERYDFALYFKPVDKKSFDFELFEISSVSMLKFCTGCSSKVSLVHFESCRMSPLNEENMQFNCIANTLQIVSDTNLNLSRFGIEVEAHDFIEGRQIYWSCLSRTIFKNDVTLPFSVNFENVPVQNVLLEELLSGLPVPITCGREEKRDLIVVNMRFIKQSNTEGIQGAVYYDVQASSSLQNQRAFNFLTCDGVRKKISFLGYLEPFDAHMWLGTIISLLIYSILMAILVSHSPKISFINSCFRLFLMNFSFLTGVANAPLKLVVNFRLNTIRILMLTWGIATIVLCSLYSSLVTTNVIAPKLLVSPWTEYKQLEKFTKIFGLNNQQEMLKMDRYSTPDKSNPAGRLSFAHGSKVSNLWFREMFAKYKLSSDCGKFHGNSSKSQVFRSKLFGFLDSYMYAIRSDVQRLKKILSVCKNTAYIDTEISIDNILHIWNQDEHIPSMVKGSPFFQLNYYWTMRNMWLLRKLVSSRMEAFTTSGIIGFWERFCLKYCKMQSESRDFQNTVRNSKAVTFKPQKLASNITSLFLIMLIISAVSTLCFVLEYFFSLTRKSLSHIWNYHTDTKCR